MRNLGMRGATARVLCAVLLAGGLLAPSALWAESSTVDVAKSQSCGCCSAWVDHLEENGFATRSQEVEADAMSVLKEKMGITQELAGCHTAQVGGYVIEGHVPAEDIARLLKERPDARGLSVPGMPQGAPGMGVLQEGERFETLLIHHDGSTEVWAVHVYEREV